MITIKLNHYFCVWKYHLTSSGGTKVYPTHNCFVCVGDNRDCKFYEAYIPRNVDKKSKDLGDKV